eukprot:GHVU01231915.1.p1 GENE.GHVU01231915.1~~GHVU01231915.1.p1  ORF type:complete len:143 (-),score=2.01 GHVU01231915.1:23-451(-)
MKLSSSNLHTHTVLGDFNYRKIKWPEKCNKLTASHLSKGEGQLFLDILDDFYMDQLFNFPTREINTLDLIITTCPDQYIDAHSPDKLSDHDVIAATLKCRIPCKKQPNRKCFLYSKGNYGPSPKTDILMASKITDLWNKIGI